MPPLYKIRDCRACGGELDTFLDLGDLHPSGFLRTDESPLDPVPHELCACSACALVQLRHTVEPDLMFRQYWYLSGINESMRAELADIAAKVLRYVGALTSTDYIVDIGANDGTLLAAFPTDPISIGFEPARNLNEALHRHANIVVADYFPRGLAQCDQLTGRVKVVTAIACFYDLDDPHAFLAAVADILHPQGIFVVQFQDWNQMQKATAFDNICTEHLFYPTLAAIERMAEPHGLRVIAAERRAINGGSYRLYLSKDARAGISVEVEALRQLEEGCEEWRTFDLFAWRCTEARKQIQGAVEAVISRGQILDLYGASTKGNTLLQWCQLDASKIRQAWERSPAKFGLRTPGSNIPIIDETLGRLHQPDALLAVIWQFRASILAREAAYLKSGGRIIFPLPQVEIVEEAS